MDITSKLWWCRCIHRSRLLWTKGSIWQLSILKQQVFKRSEVLTFYKSSSKVYKGIYKRNTDPWSSFLQPATKGMVQAKLQHELFRAIVSFVNKYLININRNSLFFFCAKSYNTKFWLSFKLCGTLHRFLNFLVQKCSKKLGCLLPQSWKEYSSFGAVSELYSCDNQLSTFWPVDFFKYFWWFGSIFSIDFLGWKLFDLLVGPLMCLVVMYFNSRKFTFCYHDCRTWLSGLGCLMTLKWFRLTFILSLR